MRFHANSLARRFLSLLAAAAFFGGAVALATGAAALWAAPSRAADTQGAPERVLIVTGEGKITATPDEAQLSTGVVTQGPTAAAALAANSVAMTRVFATIKALGIPENKIQTSNFSVYPQYSVAKPGSNEPSHVIGYQVSNQVTVVVDDLSRLGPVIDALVKNGSNQLGGVSFTFADPKPLAAKARRDAVMDAAERARTIAQAAGVTLGPILSIQEGGSETPPPRLMMAMRPLAPPPPPPIAAGEASVTASVTITYAIE